jgi:hypothetical protein
MLRAARAATKFMETQRPAASVCFRLTYYNINRVYVNSKFRILYHDLYLKKHLIGIAASICHQDIWRDAHLTQH